MNNIFFMSSTQLGLNDRSLYTHEQLKRNTQMYINISRIYWIFFHRGFFYDFMNTKDRHYIDFIIFNVKCPNVYTHAHFNPTVK